MPAACLETKDGIGSHVAQARLKAGLGQGDLAACCTRQGWNCSGNTISKIKSGHRCVADEEVVRLARALGVKMRALFLDDVDLF